MVFDLKNVREFDPNTIYLEDGQFLDRYKNGKVDFSEGLPHGILDKRYTGVGATTVEIKSPRKSIIVFPFRKLALEKFKKYEKGKELVYYVSTDENSKSKSIRDIKKFASKNKDQNIKFLVVADSIDKVVQGIENAGQNPYEDYFMTLDEVEILQMQAGFRGKLPLCFEYFNRFKRKCFVSATLLDFTNEDLTALPKYRVEKYETIDEIGQIDYKESLEIRFVDSSLPHLALSKLIAEYISDHSSSNLKFFVGLNSIRAIKQMIERLEESGVDDISVFCSDSTSDQFLKKYNLGKIEVGILPSKINIATCVAWSGIDILEPCISIAVSLNTEIHHSFSYENLIQFFGRCRLDKSVKPISYFFIGTQNDLNLFKNDVSVEKRIEELEILLLYVSNSLSSKIDKKNIEDSLCKTKNSLFYKNIQNKPSINWLLNDLEKYTNQIIESYNNKCELLLKNLESHYDANISDKDGFSDLEVRPVENLGFIHTNLVEFIDNFTPDMPENRLVNYIKKSKKSTFRVAAFWYLFARNILEDAGVGISLAEYFSGITSNVHLNVTKITVESLNVFFFHEAVWKGLKRDLLAVNKKGYAKPSKEFLKILKNDSYCSFFINIKAPRDVNHLFEFFLGVDPQSTGGNTNKYLLTNDDFDNPSLLKKFPILEKKLKGAKEFLPNDLGVQYSKVNKIENLFGEKFKKNSP